LQKEKVRIYILARELNMETMDLLDICRNQGIDVRNQLSCLDPEQRDAIVKLIQQKGSSTTTATAQAKPAQAPPVAINQPIRNLNTSRPAPGARPAPRPPAASPTTPQTRPQPQADAAPAASAAPSPPEKPSTHVASVHPAPAPPKKPVEPVAGKPTVERIPSDHRTPDKQPPEVPAEPSPETPATPARAPEKEKAGKVHDKDKGHEKAPDKDKGHDKGSEPVVTPRPGETAPPAKTPERPAATRPPEPPQVPVPPPSRPAQSGPMPNLGGGGRGLPPQPQRQGQGGGGAGGQRPRQDRPAGRPVGGGRPAMATPPAHGHRHGKAPEQHKGHEKEKGPKKLAEITPEMLHGREPFDLGGFLARQRQHHQEQQHPPRSGPPGPVAPPPPVPEVPEVEGEGEEEGDRKGKQRPGKLVGREDRHRVRSERQAKRKETTTEVDVSRIRSPVSVLETIDQQLERKARQHRRHEKKKLTGPQPRKGKVPVEVPITVRALSEAIGKRSGEVLMKLMALGQPATITINSTLEPEIAETVALDYGCELEIKRKANVEQLVVDKSKEADNPEDLRPRAPVVTIMGHVDHGKTTLLDRIRESNIVDTEAGGITQVIRAWRVEHGGRPVTFLDTPGHEAFTKMRARGANVTDIAVIVVAATDGVMPQTEEAINHAKAAGVSIVVAINKIDMPNANLRKTEQQLYGMGLIPDTMGGDVPFVYTSGATGEGIDKLLDMLSVVAELKELKANPNKPATGTCLEAHLSEGEGVFATILVQDGTLHRGDVVLVGASYGRVRAMYDDMGRPIQEAGPTVPVRITGLDEIPNADDPFLVVDDLAKAREIAEKRTQKQHDESLVVREPVNLDKLTELKVTELKVILKAEARGSIEAIRKELEKLQHEEVRVRLLHTGIGAITESDVQLALTSPQDTIMVGFNVVPDDRAMMLAEERGIPIREYKIIYQLTDDIRAALEGKLKPREEIVHLGRAVVREVFKISRVGTIAGCYVTQGTIERSAKIRVIRNGVVIYPAAERTASLESLRRFKEDAREVAQGFECGLKIAGYDDIKVDDVIEAYRIEQVQRTLS